VFDEVLQGDSIELIKNIGDDSIDAIVSDIPYGIGLDDWDVLHNNTNSALGGASSAQKDAGSLFKRRGKPLNGWSAADKKIPLEYQ
jgi:site-specific DNA-methyltransferase (adenine-specific)